MVTLNCVVCGKRVVSVNNSKKACCSLDCRKKLLEKTRPQVCAICGKTFGSLKKQKYCSRKCLYVSQAREYFYTCLNCGKEYSAKEADRNKYCSRACAFSHKTKLAAELRANKPVVIKEYQKNCDACGQLFVSKRSEKKYCSDDCARLAYLRRKYPPVSHSCPECGKDFKGHKSAIYCGPACAKRAIKRERKHKMRAGGSTGKAAITIDRLGSRDGWLCGICGKKIKPDAPRVYPAGPSIDHIIPLSRGGEHSWSNVQTAHIGCNIKKSNKLSVSQLRLDTEAGYANA